MQEENIRHHRLQDLNHFPRHVHVMSNLTAMKIFYLACTNSTSTTGLTETITPNKRSEPCKLCTTFHIFISTPQYHIFTVLLNTVLLVFKFLLFCFTIWTLLEVSWLTMYFVYMYVVVVWCSCWGKKILLIEMRGIRAFFKHNFNLETWSSKKRCNPRALGLVHTMRAQRFSRTSPNVPYATPFVQGSPEA